MLEILLEDKYSPQASEVHRSWLAAEVRLCSPPLFFAEVTSVIRERVYRSELDERRSRVLLDEAIQWPVMVWHNDNDVMQRRALEFATRFNRPKAYDAQYLALADLLGCELWTADQRLVNAVAGKLPWVRWIGEGA
jgi:predicted nucleic acid-binding protein